MSDLPASRRRVLEEAGSTNDLAREAALAGEPGWLWIVARRQMAGRGRMGRPWQSIPGNFLGSLLLRLERPLAQAASLSLVAGLAVADALAESAPAGLAPRLKWPNDVRVNGAKIAGILMEGGQEPSGGCWLVVGIGVNLADAPEGLPYPATSLVAASGQAVPVETFLDRLDRHFRARFAAWEAGGLAAIQPDWLKLAEGLGETITVRDGAREESGLFLGLAGDGALLFAPDDGPARYVSAGEIFFGRT